MKVETIVIVNLKVIYVILFFCRSLEKDVEQKLKEKYELTEKQGQGSGTAGEPSAGARKGSGTSQEVRLVGELDGQGFSVGFAPPSSKPQNSSVVEQKKIELSSGNQGTGPAKKKQNKTR